MKYNHSNNRNLMGILEITIKFNSFFAWELGKMPKMGGGVCVWKVMVYEEWVEEMGKYIIEGLTDK